jgi:TrmH family RNA methyltransferase
VRRLRRLIQKRSLRWSEGVCVLEGPDLINAALEADVEFEALYVTVSATGSASIAETVQRADDSGVRVFSLGEGVLEKIADAQSPQPILASVRFPVVQIADIAVEGLTVILHDVRDPGNAGTIIRSADAAGATAVVITGQSVDPFNPKTLRATAGSIFHLPVAVAPLSDALDHFANGGAQTFATVVRGAKSHRDVDFSKPTVVVIGNEASGLDDVSIAMCDSSITIPMAGRSESLNAAIAASLIMFEALYQREDALGSSPPRSLEEL